MSTITVTAIVAGAFVLAMAIAGAICYRAFAIPAMRPLADADREICREFIRLGRAFPFICRRAVETGLCPCQPCGVLSQAKERAVSR